MSRRMFTITRLDDAAGHWTARVTCEGVPYECSREHGSWSSTQDGRTVHVAPVIAEALQERVRPIERARKRASREAA